MFKKKKKEKVPELISDLGMDIRNKTNKTNLKNQLILYIIATKI